MRDLHHALIIDDHPLFCEALSLILANLHERPIQHVTQSGSLAEAQKLISDGLKPDIILLDLNLPDVIHLEGLMKLRVQIPDSAIVIVSSDISPQIIHDCLKSGVAGYIPKGSSKSEIVKAIHAVTHNQTYIPPDFQPQSSPTLTTSLEITTHKESLLAELTPQQINILNLLCEGLLNKQIAYKLNITEPTVKAHVSAILQKLKVNNRTQAVLMAQRQRLHDLSVVSI